MSRPRSALLRAAAAGGCAAGEGWPPAEACCRGGGAKNAFGFPIPQWVQCSIRTPGSQGAHPEGAPSQIHLVLLRYPVRRCVSRINVSRAAPLQPLLRCAPKSAAVRCWPLGHSPDEESPPAFPAGGLRRMYAWGRPVQNTVCLAYPYSSLTRYVIPLHWPVHAKRRWVGSSNPLHRESVIGEDRQSD
jgi:hypothetical protein